MAPPITVDKWPPLAAYNDRTIVVTVEETDTRKTYTVHKDVLAFYGNRFGGTERGDSGAIHEDEITFTGTEVQLFDAFVSWMYTHRFHPVEDEDRRLVSHEVLIGVWLLAYGWSMPAVQNAAINAIHQKMLDGWRVPVGELEFEYVYEYCRPGEKLREYIEDVFAATATPGDICSPQLQNWRKKDRLWKFFNEKVWSNQIGTTSREDFSRWDMCKYHEHADGVRCVEREL